MWHKPVIFQSAGTTNVRIVVDARAKTNVSACEGAPPFLTTSVGHTSTRMVNIESHISRYPGPETLSSD